MRTLLAFLAAAACASTPPPRAPATPAPAPAAALPDVGIRYRVTGDGPPLVLIHGNFSSLESWDPVVPALARRFRVIALDLPGFGETENTLGGYDAPTYALAVARVMDAAGAERAVLAGNSLGGAVACAFAARFPERTTGLVLEAPAVTQTQSTPEFQAAAGGVFDAAFALQQAPDDAAKRAHLREQVTVAARVSFRDTLTDAMIDHLTLGFTGRRFRTVLALGAAFRSGDLAPAVVEARAAHPFPILLVWGTEDRLIPVIAAEQVHAWFPDARAVVIGGAGHVIHFERPAQFAAVVTDAFAPGATFPREDRAVLDGAATLEVPGAPGTAPWLHRLLRTAMRDRLDARSRFLLALVQLALGDPDAAAATVAAIPDGAGYQAYLAGARAELQGQPSRAAYLTALRALPAAERGYPLIRLARQPLDGADAREVDAALAGAAPDAPANVRLARIDRALVQARYADAIALLAGDDLEPAVALRRAWAYAGAGDPTKARDALAQLDAPPPRPAPPSAMTACRDDLDALVAARAGHVPPDRTSCTTAVTPAELGSPAPPPPFAALADAHSPDGAIARAATALEHGDLRGARAILDAVTDAAQVPELHRMRLAVRAALGDRRAVTEARALARAHPGVAAWLLVEGTALIAAGRAAEAQVALGRALALSPDGPTREAAARAFPDAAAAITAELRQAPAWTGTWLRWLRPR